MENKKRYRIFHHRSCMSDFAHKPSDKHNTSEIRDKEIVAKLNKRQCKSLNHTMNLSKKKIKSQQVLLSRQDKDKIQNHLSSSVYKIKNLKKQQIKQFSAKVRNSNKKFVSRQHSKEILDFRLPWGTDEHRLNNYVLETLQKMQKMRKAQQISQCSEIGEKQEKGKMKTELTPNKLDQRSPSKSKSNNQLSKSKMKKKSIEKNQYEQKTYKKDNKVTENEQKSTAKQSKYDLPVKIQSKVKSSVVASNILDGQFQCIQKNNYIWVNFRVVNKKIIQLQLAVQKKAEQLSVSLSKGSFQCQSIHQSYESITPKSSIILMTAVTGLRFSKKGELQKFILPQLQMKIKDKNGTFSLQKSVVIPYNWILAAQVLEATKIKEKTGSKIKNKSIIQDIPFKKDLQKKLEKVFEDNFIKYKLKDNNLIYLYSLLLHNDPILLRIIVQGDRCNIECQSGASVYTKDVLEAFQILLSI